MQQPRVAKGAGSVLCGRRAGAAAQRVQDMLLRFSREEQTKAREAARMLGVPCGLSINDVKGKEFLGEVPATSFSFSLIQTTVKDNKPAYVSPMPGFDHTIAKRTGTFADTPTDNAQYDRLDNAEPLVLALNQKLPRPDFGPVGKPCTPPNTQRSSFSSDSTWRNGDNRLTTNDQVCMP